MQNSSKRRDCRMSRLVRGVQLVLMGAALGLGAHCSPLEGGQCAACKSDCPGDLSCEQGFCAHKGKLLEDCPEAGVSGGSTGTLTGGGTPTGGPEPTSSFGGAGAPAATDGGTLPDPCDPLPEKCTPELVTPLELHTECSDHFSITLNARCECDDAGVFRQVRWQMLGGDERLTLSAEGTLSGTLPDGEYTFVASAEIDGQEEIHNDFTLTVSDRCWVVFVRDDNAGKPYVAAGRLNSEEVTALPEPPENAELVGFDTSPEGRFVARITDTGAGRALDLVEFDQTDMVPRPFEVPGSHVAHAFSRDERWLALVTADLVDSAQTLTLVSLEAKPTVVASKPITYNDNGHLTWSDAGGILYVGRLAAAADTPVVLERIVEDGTLGAETQVAVTQTLQGETYNDIIAGPSFYVVLTSHDLVFVDRKSEPVVHRLPEVLSPDLHWLSNDAGTDLPGSVIDPLASPPDDKSFAIAPECDLVRAWSSDGSTFVCSGEIGTFVYTISEVRGSLASVPLAVPNQVPSDSPRVALSASGHWLALVPTEDLVLVPQSAYATATFEEPALLAPTGTREWDFFFTPAEERLIVQRGRSLFVFTLTQDAVSEPWEVEDIALPPVSYCTGGWDFEQDLWCGAPKFRGNLLLSPGERYLTFVSDSGDVHVVDLVEQRVFDLGPVSESHPEPNPQFL